jgi:polysaccharide export outer membrane protein
MSSCRIFNSSIMFKTPKGYQYSSPPSTPVREFKIAPNSEFELRLFSNDGFKLVDITSVESSSSANLSNNQGVLYKVEFDGTVKLPVVGRTHVDGLTIRECETMLETLYTKYYRKPFVMLKIVSKRVFVFPGSAGTGTVVELKYDNMTLIEALAQAGGIATRGKARKVKLIRGDLKNPQVFLIDLSTINGVKQADLVLQSNDIIYIEPRNDLFKGIAAEVAPIVSVLFTAITLYAIISGINK